MSSQPFAAPRPAEPFVVGEWTVHPDRNLLVRGGEERRLEARTMDVLVHLAVRAGRVVSKDDLIDAVWEGRIIAEGTLTNAVAELRAALEDDARQPRYIETIPKRGYRLVAAIADLETAEDNHAAGTRAWTRRRVAAIVAAAIVAAAVVTALVVVRHRMQRLDPERVLVLPLANRTGDSTADPLALMARDRMVQVAVDAGLGHMAPGAAPATTQEEAVRMGRDARAGLVVAGSIYLRDGELEAETQLVEVTAGQLLYAVPPVAIPEGGTGAAVAQVSDRTLGAVATHLSAHAHARLLAHPPTFAAYREFIVGSELFGADDEKAIPHLERAVEIDPDYTAAWIRLVSAYGNTGHYAEAAAIVAKLEERRPQLTRFERLLLDLLTQQDAHPEQRYATLREIDRLAPHDFIFRGVTAAAALHLNRPREALEWLGGESKVPSFLAPMMVAQLYSGRALALHMVGDYTGELAVAREGLHRYPVLMYLRSAEVRALASAGDRAAVEAAIAAALATPPLPHSAGWVILQGAAAARAHGHAALGAELADRATVWFADADERLRGIEFGLAESLFQVGGSGLARAREVLEEGVAGVSDDKDEVSVAAWGWLGALAARQGDVERAAELDTFLAGVNEPRLRGVALVYRAGIAAWRGEREASTARFREALAAGWGNVDALHDLERILFEPVAGDPYFVAVLHPEH